MTAAVGREYRKRRVKRRLYEVFGNARYSRPALHGLDAKLARHLTQRGGVFVEAGANDGYAQSNTYYFERMRGWSGVLIEPVSELAHHCRGIRRRSKVFQCALVDRAYEGDTVPLHSAGLMSTVEGALGDGSRQSSHLERALDVQKLEGVEAVRAPARLLSDVLDDAGVEGIDLLSLDVEGYEPQALGGLDWDRHAPTWICIEMNHPEAIEAALADRYELVEELTERDRLYRRRG